LISFVTVQDFPNRRTQDAIHFDSYESGLFQDPRVSVLDEQKTSQHTVSVKPKISQDKKPLFRQAAAAQGPVYCQKRRVRKSHGVGVSAYLTQPGRSFPRCFLEPSGIGTFALAPARRHADTTSLQAGHPAETMEFGDWDPNIRALLTSLQLNQSGLVLGQNRQLVVSAV